MLTRGVPHITIVESPLRLAISTIVMLCVIEQHGGWQEPALHACQLTPLCCLKADRPPR